MTLHDSVEFHSSPRVGNLAFRHTDAAIPAITVRGELQYMHLDRFATALKAAADNPAGLVLDFSLCPFIDSSALGMLVKFHKQQAQRGHCFALVVPPGTVRRTLAISRLDHLFLLFTTIEEALAACSRRPLAHAA